MSKKKQTISSTERTMRGTIIVSFKEKDQKDIEVQPTFMLENNFKVGDSFDINGRKEDKPKPKPKKKKATPKKVEVKKETETSKK